MFRRKKGTEEYDWALADLEEGAWDSWEQPIRRRLWILLVALLILITGGMVSGRLLYRKVSMAGYYGSGERETAGISMLASSSVSTSVVTPTPIQSLLLSPTLPPAVAPLSLSPPPTTQTDHGYDPQVLQEYMLNLINQDRQTNGLQPVAWDQVAADAGQRHAEDMLAWGYFSHWNTQGWGPDHRYSLAGGQHAVMENLHTFSYVYADGRGVAIEDWPEVIWNAQAGLMNSPGHRANILDPAHTHVGIGMAYDPDAGQFRLAQEFTNHYVTLDTPLPASAPPGSRLQLQGQVNGENLSRLLFSLAYEPFPEPLSLEDLAQRSTYMSSAESVEVRGLEMVFDEVTTLGDPSGLYHIRLFVDIAGQQALVLDHIVSVGTP